MVRTKTKRETKRLLEEYGPLSHEELSMRLGIDWDKTQEVIRELRRDDDVVIQINRTYELTE